MFLADLGKEEKEAFLALAREFLRSDNRVTGPERTLLHALCGEMELEPDRVLPHRERQDWLMAFQSKQAKAAALMEFLALAEADQEFGPQERQWIRQTALAFGVKEETVREMCAWHDRKRTLLIEAQGILARK